MIAEVVNNLFEVHQDGGRLKLDAAIIFKAIFEPSSDYDLALRSALKGCRRDLKFEAQVSFPVLRIVADHVGKLVLQLGLHNSKTTLATFPHSDYLVDGEVWRPLDMNEFRKFEDLVSQSGIAIGTALSPDEFYRLVWELGVEVDIDTDSGEIFSAFEAQTTESLDTDLLEATLYPYQQSGALFALSSALAGRGVLLADEMGLGKTIQAIYVLSALRKRKGSDAGHSLVVVPSSNLANWMREFEKFAPNLPVSLHHGSLRAGVLSALNLTPVVLTTYDVVSRDVDFLERVHWDLVVLDEAQNIKNANSQRANAVKRLKKTTGMAISGTPIENSLADLWSIFSFVQPELLGDAEEFKLKYPDSAASASLLSRRVAPFTIRREVKHVAQDLPEKSEFEVPIFASPSMVFEYSTLRENPSIPDLAKLTLLRQICGAPIHGTEPSPKTSRLLGLLEEVFISKNKALVFTSFTNSVDGLVASIRSRFPYLYIDTLDGRKTAQERQDAIDEFSALNSPGVLVANPKAAGVGLNIQAANYVFHFTPEWNPAQVSQATARAYRRGQTKPVFVYYFFIKDSVEEYMLEVLESKKDLSREGFSAFTENQLTHIEVSEALSRKPSVE